jgi:DNA-binding response OmpR family regulator
MVRTVVLELALGHAGHQCRRFMSGEELLRALDSNETFNAFVLERGPPDISGIELIKAIRERPHWRAPIIFTSSYDQDQDVASTLRLGADGYLIWPIQGAEFVARLEAIVRQCNQGEHRQPVLVETYRLDLDARVLFHHNHALSLTEKEFNVAVLLLTNAGRLVTREELIQCASSNASSSIRWRTVQNCVSNVRSKLELTQSNGWQLTSMYRQGYRLEKLGRNAQAPAADLSPQKILCVAWHL